MENNQDKIVKIFRDGLATHEMPVSEGVWAGIQSSIAASGASASSGMALINTASVAGVAAIVAIGAVNEIRLVNRSNEAPVEAAEEEQSPKENAEESVAVAQENEWSESYREAEKRAKTSEDSFEKASDQSTTVVVVENTHLEVEGGHQLPEVFEVSTSENEEPAVDDASEIRSTVVNESFQNRATDANEETQSEAAQENESKIPEVENNVAICSINLTHKANAVISADGDGTNDCFEIKGDKSIVDFKIMIWTQAGEGLFESNDPNFRWCGTNRFGNLVDNQTVCYYQIIAFDDSKIQYSAKNAKGSITVFR